VCAIREGACAGYSEDGSVRVLEVEKRMGVGCTVE
jgi:hypothetical protein